MRKFATKSILALALCGLTLSSCIGSFGLTNSVLNWNKGLSSSKFINELVFIVISPAYAICSMADLFVLNAVEFWTLKNGYEITAPDGEVSYLVYNKKQKSWNYQDKGALKELFRFNEDGTIQATLPDGRKMNVTPDQAGLTQVRMAVGGGVYYASR